MSRNAWISAGRISAAVAAVGLLVGVLFQGLALPSDPNSRSNSRQR